MKNLLFILIIFGLGVFPLSDAPAKTKKLKKEPSIEKILKNKEYGLVVLSLDSNKRDYKIDFQKYNPVTNQIINKKTRYSFRGPRTLLRLPKLRTEPDPRDFVFLMEEGTYIFLRVVQFTNNTYYYLCFYETIIFEITAQKINFLGDFSLAFDQRRPTAVRITKLGMDSERAQALIQETYTDLKYDFINTKVEPMELPTECKQKKEKLYIPIF